MAVIALAGLQIARRPQSFDELRGGVKCYTEALYHKNVRLGYVSDRVLLSGLQPSVRVLIMPGCYALSAPEAEAIGRWVSEGGTLLCEAHTGGYDTTRGRHSETVPGLGLADAFGFHEVNSTAVVHLGVSQESDLAASMPPDLRTAMEAFGCKGGPLMVLPTNDGKAWIRGWSRYAEIEGEGLEHLVAMPGCLPCVVAKDVGEGHVLYAGTIAAGSHTCASDPGLGWLIDRALRSAGIPLAQERWPEVPDGERLDLILTNDGAAMALSNKNSCAMNCAVPCPEPMRGLYTDQLVNNA